MRKIVLALFLLLISLWLSAQTISFADTNLLNALLAHHPLIDTDQNGEISEQEALSVDTLELSNKQIVSALELSYFSNLQRLNIASNNLDTLSLNQFPKLKYFNADYNALTSLDFSQNPELHFVSIRENNIEHIHLDANPLMDTLMADHSHVHHLKLYNCPELKYLSCGHSDVDSLNLENNQKLTHLDFHGAFFKQIVGIENLTELVYLDLEDGALTQLDVSNCSQLNFLYVNTNQALSEVCINSDQLNNKVNCTPAHCFNKGQSTNWSTSCGVISGIGSDVKLRTYAFPNPASDFINVPEPIMDCIGVAGKHYDLTQQSGTVSLDKMTAGVYFFRYVSGRTERIVIW